MRAKQWTSACIHSHASFRRASIFTSILCGDRATNQWNQIFSHFDRRELLLVMCCCLFVFIGTQTHKTERQKCWTLNIAKKKIKEFHIYFDRANDKHEYKIPDPYMAHIVKWHSYFMPASENVSQKNRNESTTKEINHTKKRTNKVSSKKKNVKNVDWNFWLFIYLLLLSIWKFFFGRNRNPFVWHLAFQLFVLFQ